MNRKWLVLFSAITAVFLLLFLDQLVPRTQAAPAHSRIVINATAVQPTITVSPTAGYAGQTITASGQSISPYDQIRLAWWLGESTETALIAPTAPDFSYAVTTTIPSGVTGTVQLCTAVTSAETADFACENVTILTAPPGSVGGTFPTPTRQSAAQSVPGDQRVYLFDDVGQTVDFAEIQTDGTFTFTNLPPDTYEAIVAGIVPDFVGLETLDVVAGQQSFMNFDYSNIPDDCNLARITGIYANILHREDDQWLVGTLIEDVPLQVEVIAVMQIQAGASVDHVQWDILRNGYGSASLPTDMPTTEAIPGFPYIFKAVFDAADLGGISGTTYQQLSIRFRPFVNNGLVVNPCTPASLPIKLLKNPVEDASITGEQISWNAERGLYEFSGSLIPALLSYPTPDLPLVGALDNSLNAGLQFGGSFNPLTERVSLDLYEATASATLLNLDLFNASRSLPGFDNRAWDTAETLNFPIETTVLDSFEDTVEVYRGQVWSGWGVIDVNAAISFGIQGDLKLSGDFYPYQGAFDARLTPSITPDLSVSIWVDILFGVVSAGADATTALTVQLPYRIATQNGTLQTNWEDPCLRLDVDITAWARVNTWVWKKKWSLEPYSLIDYASDDCPANRAPVVALEQPKILNTPDIASSPNGETWLVEVVDSTPAAISATTQIALRQWLTATESWDTPTYLTDGSTWVQDPVLTFVGTTDQALVVWVENDISETEYDATQSLADVLNYLDLWYAYWDGLSWSAPLTLTQDLLADGRPTVAGDALGATVAWVRDGDGDAATRIDQRIAVAHWDNSGQQWGEISLLQRETAVPAAAPPAARSASGTSFTVQTDLDTTDNNPGNGVCADAAGLCSLRAAIMETNALTGDDIILLPAGNYTLTIAGQNETNAVTGDLNILDDLTIRSVGGTAVIDANQIDRVLTVYVPHRVTLAGLTLQNGKPPTSGRGGAIFSTGSVTLTNSTIRDNNGTAIDITSLYNSPEGNLTLENVTLRDNNGAIGGAIDASGNVVRANNVYVRGNDAGLQAGGFNLSNATLYLTNSILELNDGWNYGGGVYAYKSQLYITNTTFSRNFGYYGSGIYALSASSGGNTILIESSTLKGWNGGTLYSQDNYGNNSISLHNTILTDDTNNCDGNGLFTSTGYNLENGTSCGLSSSGDITGTNPLLQTLADNGGATLTHPLGNGSPAIDAGDPVSCPATDQRGYGRPADGNGDSDARCDIGAFENGATDPAAHINAQPSVARDNGTVLLAWTVDNDANLTSNTDRRILVAEWISTTASWQQTIPAELPAGADSPSLTITDSGGEQQLAFVVRGKDGDGSTDTGLISNEAIVWSAGKTAAQATWSANQLVDQSNRPIRGERPRPFIQTGTFPRRGVIFRQFGNPGSNGALGQLAMVENPLPQLTFGPPLYLTDEGQQHWQVAVVPNRTTRQLLIVDVERDLLGLTRGPQRGPQPAGLAPATQQTTPALRQPTATVKTVTAVPNTFIFDPAADPALDPALGLSQQYASSGSPLIITTTLRNVGRSPAVSMTVHLYAGHPLSGTLLATQPVTATLAFNEMIMIPFAITAPGGAMTYTAILMTTGEDNSVSNNTATTHLGNIPAPINLTVRGTHDRVDAFDISWTPVVTSTITGYRILRSSQPGGPYELVGKTSTPHFTDWPVITTKSQVYVVQAIDENGVQSAYSMESACTATPLSPAVSASYVNNSALFAWDSVADATHYEIWTHENSPYFQPGDPGTVLAGQTSTPNIALANLTQPVFVTVRAVSGCQLASPPANQTAAFTFDLTP